MVGVWRGQHQEVGPHFISEQKRSVWCSSIFPCGVTVSTWDLNCVRPWHFFPLPMHWLNSRMTQTGNHNWSDQRPALKMKRHRNQCDQLKNSSVKCWSWVFAWAIPPTFHLVTPLWAREPLLPGGAATISRPELHASETSYANVR